MHPDQTGFIKGRHSSENLQRFYNIIHLYKTKSDTKNGHSALLLTLDAEKSFDRVGWPFHFTSLSCFGFGSYFIYWITILYNTPSASVITNGKISKSFNLNRGTRQGCPLSPLLFALFIEPLASAIRQNDNISGIYTNSHCHKISLYADDIILYLTPSTSLLSFHNLINNFGKVAGYSINWSKSAILPLTHLDWNAEVGDLGPYWDPINTKPNPLNTSESMFLHPQMILSNSILLHYYTVSEKTWTD